MEPPNWPKIGGATESPRGIIEALPSCVSRQSMFASSNLTTQRISFIITRNNLRTISILGLKNYIRWLHLK